MSINYRAVGWNRQKKIYDLWLAVGVLLYLAGFIVGHVLFKPLATPETILIRGFGTAALILLHVILSIGPLCRLDNRFLPLLYNRRHMGVTMFILALAHAGLAMMQYHFFSDVNPIASVFISNGRYESIAFFPFQPLGFLALIIFYLMAATSHDFWLTNLTAPIWKALHMGVYVAYALIICHVALGSLQADPQPVPAILLGAGLIWVFGIHMAAGLKERSLDKNAASGEWVEVCDLANIADNKAKIVCCSGERIAIFKYDGMISAISNVCQHQNGPLGEGKIIDGCVVCPWHGYQYKPADGSSPPPFTEKIPTFHVKVENGVVFVNPKPNPPGTYVEPVVISGRTPEEAKA